MANSKISLGNTCYMNATIQALRAVPELRFALSMYAMSHTYENSSVSYFLLLWYFFRLGQNTGLPLPKALYDLYKNMGTTTDSVNPNDFLQALREVRVLL